MDQQLDILTLAYKQTPVQGQWELLYEKENLIPGSVQYSVRRYQKDPQWNMDDIGMMVYHYEKNDAEKNYLELKFCVSKNIYCRQKDSDCDQCGLNPAKEKSCDEGSDSVNVLSFRFSPVHLSQFVKPRYSDDTLVEDILNFRHHSPFTKIVPLCGRMRAVLDGLLNHNFSDTLENIYVNAQTQMLLLYALGCMLGEKELDVVSCKFLANEADREKIIKAREILIEHIGEPITIRELSRKVAINECYLKKGFKEMFGTTIFDFYQSQRMEHAKYLLYEKGLSVTEVSLNLGYSSISHFSTAFKKHTGLKPCELLLR